jgi:outer membrane protein TolC
VTSRCGSALTAYTNEQDRYVALLDAVKASQLSRELSNELYTNGLGPFLNVLEAQRAVYSSQDAMIQSETAIIADLISLYKSLGGGWQPPEGRTADAG